MKRDKYALYWLKGKRVSVLVPPRFTNSKRRIEGVVHHVKRDVLKNRIEIGIKKELFLFREPSQIIKKGKCVLFVYGDNKADESDTVFFDELRSVSLKGGDVNVALNNMESDEILMVSFEVIDDGQHAGSSVQRRKGRGNSSTSSKRSGSGKATGRDQRPKSGRESKKNVKKSVGVGGKDRSPAQSRKAKAHPKGGKKGGKK